MGGVIVKLGVGLLTADGTLDPGMITPIGTTQGFY